VLFVDFHHVSGAGAFSALSDLELHDIVFRQGFESGALNFGMMHEQILASAVRGDEAIALLVAEPLYLTSRHTETLLNKSRPIERTVRGEPPLRGSRATDKQRRLGDWPIVASMQWERNREGSPARKGN